MGQTNITQEQGLADVVRGKEKSVVDAITAALFEVVMYRDKDMECELSYRGIKLSEEEIHILNMEVIRIRMESGLM